MISEKAMNELSGAAAEYNDVSCTPQDVEMHLERIARGEPLSARAASKSAQELSDYLAQMSRRKGGGQPEKSESCRPFWLTERRDAFLCPQKCLQRPWPGRPAAGP